VHGEDVQVPVWHRGNENAYLLEPRFKQLAILGLGTSIGTPNITAEALVVQSFDELQQQAAVGNTSGKIIVFNQQCNWTAQPVGCYGLTAQYRYSGASEASRVGGVAALARSLTGFSIYSPHTGVQGYDDDVVPIPAASITVEDADMLQRMQARGQRIVITLSMQAQNMGNTTQQNFIAEVVGSQYPDQVVLVSGHLDSWDVGQGAMDDGGGAFISWEVLSAVNALGLKPKRTLRFLGWACEEFGGIGADQYFAAHQDEVPNMDFVLESDMGTFTPYGIQFTGNAAAQAVMREVLQLLQPINATTLVLGGGGEDVNPWMRAGVPGGSLANYNHNYFDFHHSNGDTMDVYTPDELDLAAATWAVTAYAVANLQDMLPRNSTAHPPPPPAKPWMWR
jgi:carboxypeptidase Q